MSETNAEDLKRYTVDGVGRVYTNLDDLWLPSVTTVLSMRPTPTALKNWKERTDNWEEIMTYKQNRGTMIHYDCLNQFAEEDMWSPDEASSDEALNNRTDWKERFAGERKWASDVWDLIRRVTPLQDPDNVLDVETFVINTDIGYGGQFDLLYHDPETDETVLGDIKTSKGIYDKHLLQLSAYREAVPIAIDRMEVIRMNPDKQDWRVFPSHEWPTDPDDLWNEFVACRRKLEEERMDSVVTHVRDRAEKEGLDAESQPT